MGQRSLNESETRELILEQAHALFVDIGYKKTTVGDIAQACGFSPAKVHKYFGTKSAINQAIAGVMMDEKLAEAHAAIAGEKTAAGKLRAFVTTVHESTLESFRNENRVFETLYAAAEEKWESVTDYRLSLQAIVLDIVRQGVADGEFQSDDPVQTAEAMHRCLVSVFHPAIIVEMLDAPDSASVDAVIDLFLASLGQGGTHPAQPA